MKQPVPIGDTKVAFTVKLSQELVRRVRSFANITGLSLSEIVSRALLAVLKQRRERGAEMLNLVTFTTSILLTALVTDLSGDVLWAYDPGTSVPAGSLVEPIKLLPNGHFLITFTVSTVGLASSCGQWIWREPEVDLAGTVIWRMTSTDLNSNFSSVSKLSKRGLVEPHPLSP